MVPSTKQKDQLLKRVLHIRQVSRVNSGGKIRSTSALVIVGNQNGSAGMGMGRGKDTLSAVTKVSSHLTKATDQAEKNMISFPRLDNRTFFSDVDFKFHNVTLKLQSARPGHGLICNNYIHEVCRCVGISDLVGKVYGSRNPMNIVKAMFLAMSQQTQPEIIARMRGKKVMDVERMYYGVELVNRRK